MGNNFADARGKRSLIDQVIVRLIRLWGNIHVTRAKKSSVQRSTFNVQYSIPNAKKGCKSELRKFKNGTLVAVTRTFGRSTFFTSVVDLFQVIAKLLLTV